MRSSRPSSSSRSRMAAHVLLALLLALHVSRSVALIATITPLIG